MDYLTNSTRKTVHSTIRLRINSHKKQQQQKLIDKCQWSSSKWRKSSEWNPYKHT